MTGNLTPLTQVSGAVAYSSAPETQQAFKNFKKELLDILLDSDDDMAELARFHGYEAEHPSSVSIRTDEDAIQMLLKKYGLDYSDTTGELLLFALNQISAAMHLAYHKGTAVGKTNDALFYPGCGEIDPENEDLNAQRIWIYHQSSEEQAIGDPEDEEVLGLQERPERPLDAFDVLRLPEHRAEMKALIDKGEDVKLESARTAVGRC
ncbi:MAG: hypothetical protein J0M34_00060 [Alphaproteobacteria bacterium]|nr:hypothetical protein [Alphaproteobacteria bacterium]